LVHFVVDSIDHQSLEDKAINNLFLEGGEAQAVREEIAERKSQGAPTPVYRNLWLFLIQSDYWLQQVQLHPLIFVGPVRKYL